MSNTPIDRDLDRAVDEYLQGESEYSRRYRRVNADAIPPDLDRAVLAHAQSHLSAKSNKAPLTFWTRLAAPVALAASVVLVVSIVIKSNVQEQPLRRMGNRVEEAPIQEREANVPLPSAPAPSTAAAVSEQSNARTAAHSPSLAIPLKKSTAPIAAEEEIAPTEYDALQSTRVANATKSAEPLAANVSNASDAVPMEQRKAVAPTAAAESAEIASAPAAKAPVASSRPGATDLQEVIVTAQLKHSTHATGAGPRGTIAPQAFQPSADKVEKENRESQPELWLAYIRQLRTDHKDRKADREWRRFVKAYPDYRVADDDTARPKK